MSKRSWRKRRAALRVGTGFAAVSLLVPPLATPASAAEVPDREPMPTALRGDLSGDSLAIAQARRVAALPAVSSGPELWRGRVLDPAGRPVRGSVIAYARPSGEMLRTMTEGKGGRADALVPIAKADSAANGEFVVNASLPPELEWMESEDGSLTVMIVATINGAIGLSMNTVWWTPPTGGTPGVWATTNPRTSNGAKRSSTAPAADEPPSEFLRPFDLQLEPTGTTGRATSPSGMQAAVVPPGNCVHWASRTHPDSKAYVGLTYQQKSKYWTTDFTYRNTNTSSFQTGWAAGGGSHGLSFEVAGSVTTSSSTTFAGTIHTTSSKNVDTARKHWITVHMNRHEWRCWNSNTPPPANPGQWPRVDTLEPGAWLRDFAIDPGGMPGCDIRNASRRFLVAPGATISRENSSAVSIQNSINGNIGFNSQNVAFHLGVYVRDDYSRGTSIGYSWTNSSTSNKYLCGLDGPVKSNTRVVAMATKP